jgi:hypothetical protein
MKKTLISLLTVAVIAGCFSACENFDNDDDKTPITSVLTTTTPATFTVEEDETTTSNEGLTEVEDQSNETFNKTDYSAGLALLSPDVFSEMGMSAEEILKKYNVTDVTPPLDFFNSENGHYAFGTDKYVDYGVISLDVYPFTKLFLGEEIGITPEDLAKKYNFKVISKYTSELDGVIAVLYAGDYTISLTNLDNGFTTEYTSADIVNLKFYSQYKFGITPEDLSGSVVIYFGGSDITVKPNTDVKAFLSDPVTAKIALYINAHYENPDWSVIMDGVPVTDGLIDDNTSIVFPAYGQEIAWKITLWN